jgi:hypothetical protein
LLIHGVARFVQGTEQPFGQILLIDPGGDAHVANRKFGSKGVQRFILTASLEIITESFDDLFTKTPLFRFREMLMKR